MTAPDDGRLVLETPAVAIPAYLHETYAWAYLNPRNVHLLDRDLVVLAILWGNDWRLRRAVINELRPGEDVLQVSHVYGSIIPNLARLVGPRGHLEVMTIEMRPAWQRPFHLRAEAVLSRDHEVKGPCVRQLDLVGAPLDSSVDWSEAAP